MANAHSVVLVHCPVCGTDLHPCMTTHGAAQQCARCQGAWLALSALRCHVSVRVADWLWAGALHSPTSDQRRCPRCTRAFRVLLIEYGRKRASFELDACISCECFWFDAGELERVPLAPNVEAEKTWVRVVGWVLTLLQFFV
jgi:Zn-finger nucleic acid-binding protein